MRKDYKDKLFVLYDDFSNMNDAKGQQKAFTEIEQLLESQSDLDSDDYYIWGLTYYMNDNNITDKLEIAQKWFKKSLELDDYNFLARLYLAHCFHDQIDYLNALENYEKVNKLELKKFQIWRYVKLVEQIGFCYYKLGQEKMGLECFREVVEWYEKSKVDDLAVPMELLTCLPANHEYVTRIKKIEDYL